MSWYGAPVTHRAVMALSVFTTRTRTVSPGLARHDRGAGGAVEGGDRVVLVEDGKHVALGRLLDHDRALQAAPHLLMGEQVEWYQYVPVWSATKR